MTEKVQMKRAGRVFMVGLPGPALDDSTRDLVASYGVNNFILFKRNVTGPEQLRQLCSDLVSFCREQSLPEPLIAIDQEGGTVARLGSPFTVFPDARVLADSPDAVNLLRRFSEVCVSELLGVGINMNLAPVLDVCEAGRGYFMERRSLGGDPGQVAALGETVIRAMQDGGLAACAKHFPGLGRARLDPHELLPTVDLDRKTLYEEDLLPFRVAADAGVAAIMTSHTRYSGIDDARPATLSRKILTGLLRETLSYDGMVVTDDLEMGAIENHYSVAQAAGQAFVAGADLLLICHEQQKVREAHAVIAGLVANDSSVAEQLDRAVSRIEDVQRRFSRKNRENFPAS